MEILDLQFLIKDMFENCKTLHEVEVLQEKIFSISKNLAKNKWVELTTED